MTSNAWLGFVFVTWVLVLLTFSLAYYRIYRRDPDEFLHHPEVRAKQRATRLEIAQRTLENLRLRRRATLEYADAFAPTRQTFEALPDGDHRTESFVFRVTNHAYVGAASGGLGGTYQDVTVLDHDHRPVCDLPPIKDVLGEVRSIDRQIARWDVLVANPSDALATSSYADFLYFSVVTQTTVGYGDILPNSTRVRMLVAAQLLLGLILLGVAINAVV